MFTVCYVIVIIIKYMQEAWYMLSIFKKTTKLNTDVELFHIGPFNWCHTFSFKQKISPTWFIMPNTVNFHKNVF